MESTGRSRIYRGLEMSHLDLPSLLQTTDLSLITEYNFHTKLLRLLSDFSAIRRSFSFQSCIPVTSVVATSGVWLLHAWSTFFCVLFSGSQAAGAAGCQHPGREDGEQDADGGDWAWYGQHHISELHGLPGGNSQGKYSAQSFRPFRHSQVFSNITFIPKTKRLQTIYTYDPLLWFVAGMGRGTLQPCI